jgi:hypothetical protein
MSGPIRPAPDSGGVGAAAGGWLRSNVVTLAIAGVLVVGGGVGLVFNRPAGAEGSAAAVVPGDPATDLTTPVTTARETLPAPTLVRSSMPVRFADAAAPDNPFLRTAAEPVGLVPAATGAASVSPGAGAAPTRPALAARSSVPAAPGHVDVPATPAAPAAEDLLLTGVVQGEPPLAVVKFSGQSFFLKIGDQVADTWRLVEIKERSAMFQLGAQRVEIPIKGGSSE